MAPGQVPDPLRAHGAWVYLAVSVLAGVLAPGAGSLGAALAAGSVFVGLFVLAGSVAIVGRRGAKRRAAVGLLVTTASLLLALGLAASPGFLAVGLLALPPAAVAGYFAERRGFLSPGALSFGVLTLVVSAPFSARAAGVPLASALLTLAILAPFFVWRTWRLARALGPGWSRARLARRGLLESALALAWAAVAIAVVRGLA